MVSGLADTNGKSGPGPHGDAAPPAIGRGVSGPLDPGPAPPSRDCLEKISLGLFGFPGICSGSFG